MTEDTSTTTEGTPSVADSAAEVATGVAFSGQQRTLVRALRECDVSLSTMYLGGVLVLDDHSNPDRFAQCAHSIRELMEKLPELLDVPMKAHQESLTVKVREIEDAYRALQKNTRCFSPSNGWGGIIDGHLQKFLMRLASLFEWLASHRPRRRDEIYRVLEQLDASDRGLPSPLAFLDADAWSRQRDYFVMVAHHRRATNEEEFRQWLDALERFLLDRLQPRTFEDFEEIDAILEEASKDAQRRNY